MSNTKHEVLTAEQQASQWAVQRAKMIVEREKEKERLLDRLSGRYQANLRTRFLEAAKGLTAHQAARALNKADSGHDYRRCSKGDMVAALCHREGYVVEAAISALRGAVRS